MKQTQTLTLKLVTATSSLTQRGTTIITKRLHPSLAVSNIIRHHSSEKPPTTTTSNATAEKENDAITSNSNSTSNNGFQAIDTNKTKSKATTEPSSDHAPMTNNTNSNTNKSKTTETKAPAVEASDDSDSSADFLNRLQQTVLDTSGLTELERLKTAVEEASIQFDKATKNVAHSRVQVEQAQKAHDLAHKKHVHLLMRREDWSGEDAQSFVNITAEEVSTRQHLVDAQAALKRAEDYAITAQHTYMDAMRKRYHEEQLWQDKWRLLGTYGTWSLIGINTCVFLGGQMVTQRREMNRLKHMEELLVKHQEENKKVFESNHKAHAAARGAEEDDTTTTSSSSTKKTEERPQEQMLPPPDGNTLEFLQYRVSQSVKDLPLPPIHTPSFALGAVVSASCMTVLMLIVSSRR